MTDVEVVAGPGSVERLADLVAGFAPRRVLVVGSPTAVARTGIARRLTGYQLELFGDFTPNPPLAEGLRGSAQPQCRAPLALVPTAAGTGSEVTGFATVYVGEVKYSLDHPSVHADLAIVDPELTGTCPADVAFSGALERWRMRSSRCGRGARRRSPGSSRSTRCRRLSVRCASH